MSRRYTNILLTIIAILLAIGVSRVFFTFFKQPPPANKVAELMSMDIGEEKLVFTQHAAYLYIPGSAARSQISNIMLEKQLKVAATTRNFNTVGKLVEMSREGGEQEMREDSHSKRAISWTGRTSPLFPRYMKYGTTQLRYPRARLYQRAGWYLKQIKHFKCEGESR